MDRLQGTRLAGALGVTLLLACGNDASSTGGTGGVSGTGGTSDAGGSAGTGGTSGTGGTGGSAGTGGTVGTGGTAGSGGTSGSGGTAGTAGNAGNAGAGGNAGSPSDDLTIEGSRFTKNGGTFFPVGNFLTSSSGAGPRTHTYLSEQVTDAERQQMLSIAAAAGYNVLSIYTYNEGDYGGVAISPYAGGGFGGAFDTSKLSVWQSRVDAIVAAGMHPIIWLVPDDSSGIHAASISELQTYITRMVATFDALPVLWILALEADEYWDASRVETLGNHLAAATTRPAGVHQLSGKSSYMQADWVDFGAYQYGFGKTWQQIFDATVTVTGSLGKPMIAMEYDLDDGDNDDRLGLAAAFGGAQGVGNGAPPGLATFIEGLPTGMTSARTNTHATLEGGGVTAVADMSTLSFGIQ